MSNREIPSLLAALLERLEARLTGQESLALEFKSARGGLPGSLWETVSAFANTNGGWILLGINDQAEPIAIEGVPNANTMLQTFFSQSRNPQKISKEVCGAGDASIETLAEREVIVLRIPAVPRRSRPVFINGNPYTGTYVRRHAGDYHCTEAEVNRMIREASEATADATVLPNYGWADLNHATFAGYRQRFRTAKPDSPWNGYSDQDFLQAIHGYRQDGDLGIEGITVAGLLMFGRPEAIRDHRGRHLIDYRLLPDDLNAAINWDDRVVWEGNLLDAFNTIAPRLVAGLPVPFRLQGVTRVDETPAHGALREALVNLLVHADYGETAASLILHSPAGFLFRNPGSSRVPAADLGLGDRSDPRNPELVFMFRQIGLAEEAGSGIPRILRAWRELGYRLPTIDVGTERYEFSLQLRHVHLFSEEDHAWLLSLGEPWSEPEQLALLIARHEGEVDNLALRSLTGQHPADTTKVLGGLRDRDYLEMIGGGRGARYMLGPGIPRVIAASATVAKQTGLPMLDSGAGIQDSTPAIPDSAVTIPVSAAAIPDSAAAIPVPAASLEDSPKAVRDSWPDLWQLAASAHDRHHVPARSRDELIVQLCRVVPLSLRELSILLNRSLKHMRQVVATLVQAGRLDYANPDQPKHPHQRYIAVAATPNVGKRPRIRNVITSKR